MANFNEVLEQIKESTKGKKAKTFSRTDFDTLMKAYINDVSYEGTVVKVENGEPVEKTIKPVEAFRGMLEEILIDFGIDKQEAARIKDDSYAIKHVDCMYEFISEIVYKYMEAGKKFDFMPRYDFVGSISLDEKEDSERECTNPRTKEKIVVKSKKHKELKQKSKCPSWLKSSK